MKSLFGYSLLIPVTLLYLQIKTHRPPFSQDNNCVTTQKIFRKKSKYATIEGIILDCRTQEPVKTAIIRINKTIVHTDTSGHFRHQIKPGNYMIKAGWPTYLWQRINTTVKNKDSLFVTFYLEDDPEPLK